MRKKVLFGFLPSWAVLAFLLNPAPAEPPLQSLAKAPVKRGTGFCCPLYKIMDHGTYSTWYAKKCGPPPSYCPLDTTAGPGSCEDPNHVNCVTVIGFTAAAAGDTDPRGGHQVHPDLKEGILKGDVKRDPIHEGSKPFAKLLAPTKVVQLQVLDTTTDESYAWVALDVALVAPLDIPSLVMPNGVEVKRSSLTAQEIASAEKVNRDRVTKTDGNVFYVSYGQFVYQVVLDARWKGFTPVTGVAPAFKKAKEPAAPRDDKKTGLLLRLPRGAER